MEALQLFNQFRHKNGKNIIEMTPQKILCVRHAGDCVRLRVVKNLDVIDTFSMGVRKSLANVRTSLAFFTLAVRIVL